MFKLKNKMIIKDHRIFKLLLIEWSSNNYYFKMYNLIEVNYINETKCNISRLLLESIGIS